MNSSIIEDLCKIYNSTICLFSINKTIRPQNITFFLRSTLQQKYDDRYLRHIAYPVISFKKLHLLHGEKGCAHGRKPSFEDKEPSELLIQL